HGQWSDSSCGQTKISSRGKLARSNSCMRSSSRRGSVPPEISGWFVVAISTNPADLSRCNPCNAESLTWNSSRMVGDFCCPDLVARFSSVSRSMKTALFMPGNEHKLAQVKLEKPSGWRQNLRACELLHQLL